MNKSLSVIALLAFVCSASPAYGQEPRDQQLWSAASAGDSGAVATLLRQGASADATRAGSPALVIAAQQGHVGVVDALLGHGAAVDASARGGVTALFMASQQGHLEVVRSLLRHDADIEAKRGDGTTPLIRALVNGHFGVAEVLLEQGADVNAAMNNGATPLMAAAQQGHVTLVRALLNRGADVDARSGGRTAVDFARLFNHENVAQLLLQSTFRSSESVSAADVRAAQERLTLLGYDPGPIDGAWGAKTADAVLSFQRDLELDQTARLDTSTVQRLMAARRIPTSFTRGWPSEITTQGSRMTVGGVWQLRVVDGGFGLQIGDRGDEVTGVYYDGTHLRFGQSGRVYVLLYSNRCLAGTWTRAGVRLWGTLYLGGRRCERPTFEAPLKVGDGSG